MSAADYFTKTALVAQTLARASAVNTNLTALETAFGRFPDRIITDTGRITFAVTAGAADVYTVALHKTAAAYYNGMAIDVEIHATNTGACTINVDSLGAKAIKIMNNTDPAAGDLTAGDYLTLRYDDTNGYFVITSTVRSIINGQASMSDAEIKTAYENNSDTNAFTDAQQTKLGYLTLTGAVDLDDIDDLLTPAAAGTSEADKPPMMDANGNLIFSEEVQATCYLGTQASLSGTTPTIDCDEANFFTLTTSGNTTFTFSYAGVNLTTNDVYGFILKVTAGGTHSLTWPAAVDWEGGTAPDAPASGETDLYHFLTFNGGTTWYGVWLVDDAS